jgi:hypothetical protein
MAGSAPQRARPTTAGGAGPFDLVVCGVGLVSPSGATSRDHAFFLRAGVSPLCSSPFVLADDTALPVAYCPWIESIGSVDARMAALARGALQEALAPMRAATGSAKPRAAAFLCAPASRPGLTEEALSRVAAEVGRSTGVSSAIGRATGAAGCFPVIRRAAEVLAGPDVNAVVLVAVDSWMSVDALAMRVKRPNPWLPSPPVPAEAGAAIVLTTSQHAAQLGVAPLGRVYDSRIATSGSNDENDEAADGAAMTGLLYQLPGAQPIAAAFGQDRVDALRGREWQFAAARMAGRFDHDYDCACLEWEVGDVGAAAGVANLVYAIASLRHRTTSRPGESQRPFVAWAISRDGTRGIALGQVASP